MVFPSINIMAARGVRRTGEATMGQVRSTDRTSVVAALIDRLVPTLRPDEIYLFGSQARDEASSDSDYDVLVIVDTSDEPAYRRQQAAYRALWGLGVPVDVLVLTRAEFERQARVVTSLPATVRREGRRVYAA